MKQLARKQPENAEPSPFRSRAYNVIKRLSIGLLFTGTIGLAEAIWFSKFDDPWDRVLEIVVLFQLALIPISMIAWGVISPRSFPRRHSIWLVFAWILLFLLGLFLSLEFTLFAASWAVWPPQSLG